MSAGDHAKRQAFTNLDATDHDDELGQILAVIARFAATGAEFSANEVRPHLPKVEKTGRIGRAYSLAIEQGWLEVRTTVKSSKRNTHSKPVYVYVGRVAKGAAA